MKIYPVQDIQINSSSHTNTSTALNPIPSNRAISWQPIATCIFLFENYILHLSILVYWYSYIPLICIPFSFIPFIMAIKCIRSSWIIPQQLIMNSQQNKYLIVHNGKLQSFKECSKCKVYLNSRIIHCRKCDGCHLGYDHFCAWLSCCIHIGNYRFFLYFIFSSFLSFLFISISDFCSFILIDDKIVIILSSISFFQSILSMVYTVYVCIFHSYLMSHGISTKQYFLNYRNKSTIFMKMLCIEVDPQIYFNDNKFENQNGNEDSLTQFEQTFNGNSPLKRLKRSSSQVSPIKKY